MDFERALNNQLAGLKRALAEPDTDKNFIMVIDKVCVEPNTGSMTGLSHGASYKVKRFTQREASSLAQTCQNGNGVYGEGLYWRSVTEEAIVTCEKCLELFKRKAD